MFSITSQLNVNVFSVGLYDHFEPVFDSVTFQPETSSETCCLCLHTAVSLIQRSIISEHSAPGQNTLFERVKCHSAFDIDFV